MQSELGYYHLYSTMTLGEENLTFKEIKIILCIILNNINACGTPSLPILYNSWKTLVLHVDLLSTFFY